ncbi:MAG: hypothetical protein A2Z24_02110 [Candidatus Woykebacteria bacterium RBG_16_44_10]|uniref:8-oxo-dGTP diphosphatase n=1 Tax=Candidatus Woykebacteria bacterium RBG_16_44_10 TaxID=1802597 RepID=A0A1G1WFW0_9BACT|nr:MAG: hypothetical protein A2Z24_02110 [Candidatus Woykebacteria bacterium RBG_16_44_10]
MPPIHLAAGGLLIHPDGRVLMQHRDKNPSIAYPNHWCIPGGKIEPGEKPRQAAIRELQEESGYIMASPRLLVTEDYNLPNGSPVKRRIFWGIYDGKQAINCFEGQEMLFIHPSQLPLMKIYPGHKRIILAALKRISKIKI